MREKNRNKFVNAEKTMNEKIGINRNKFANAEKIMCEKIGINL